MRNNMAKKSTKSASKKAAAKKPTKKGSAVEKAIEDQSRLIIELLHKKEDLLPELEPFRFSMFGIGGFSHPLFHGIVAKDGCFAYVNYLFRDSQNRLEKCRKKKDFYGAVFCYTTPHLMDGFIEEMDVANDKTYWTVLGAVWIRSESPWVNRKLFLQLFNDSRPHRENLMDADERRAFKKLPDQLTIYRGFGGDRGKGLSWTLDRDKAVWFANRFHVIHGKPGRVIEGICKKTDVFAYFTNREESEIVIDPEKVRGQKKVLVKK